MTEEDARKAIAEYAEATSGAGGAPSSTQLIADALVIVENAMSNPRTKMEPSKPAFRFNAELHRVETILDERLEAIKRTQQLLQNAVNAVAEVLLAKALKEAMP
jgi:hypothetical protein